MKSPAPDARVAEVHDMRWVTLLDIDGKVAGVAEPMVPGQDLLFRFAKPTHLYTMRVTLHDGPVLEQPISPPGGGTMVGPSDTWHVS